MKRLRITAKLYNKYMKQKQLYEECTEKLHAVDAAYEPPSPYGGDDHLESSSAIDDQPAAPQRVPFADVISSVNVEDYDSEFDSDVDVRCAHLGQKDCKDAASSFGLLCNWNGDTENCDKDQPHNPAAPWIRTTESDREWGEYSH